VDAQSCMDWGLLWFDDNHETPFATRVKKAAQQYLERFGRAPDVCYVHPMMLLGAETTPEDIEVLESACIQPDHFWIGVKSSSH